MPSLRNDVRWGGWILGGVPGQQPGTRGKDENLSGDSQVPCLLIVVENLLIRGTLTSQEKPIRIGVDGPQTCFTSQIGTQI